MTKVPAALAMRRASDWAWNEGNDSGGRLTDGDIMGLRMGTNQLHIDDKVVPSSFRLLYNPLKHIYIKTIDKSTINPM